MIVAGPLQMKDQHANFAGPEITSYLYIKKNFLLCLKYGTLLRNAEKEASLLFEIVNRSIDDL